MFIIFFWASVAGALCLLRRHSEGWRQAALLAAVFLGSFIILSTEVLSFFQAVRPFWVRLLWVLLTVGLWGFYFWKKPANAPSVKSKKTAKKVMPAPKTPVDWMGVLMLVGIGLILAATAVIAFVAPPNNWDSMTYHLSRVAHWIDQGSVDFYATNIQRQNWRGPGAEFVILHLQLLAGSDRWANFVQWLSFAGSIAGVSLLAGFLGAGVLGQILAGAAVATMPLGILEATSTQVDLFFTFWITAGSVFLWRAWLRGSWLEAAFCGAAFGIAFLTRSVVLLPLILWILWRIWLKGRLLAAKALAAMVIAFIVINAGFVGRCVKHQTDGQGMSRMSGGVINEVFTVPAIVSNFSRGLASQIMTRSEQFNNGVWAAVEGLHKMIGADPDDTRTTFGDRKGARLHLLMTDEDYAGNPWHVLLILVALPVVVLRRKTEAVKFMLLFVLSVIAFSAVFKWQPWITRFHLPLLALSMAWVGVAFDGKRWISLLAGLGLLVAAVPFVMNNHTRPLTGKNSIFNHPREVLYFFKQTYSIRPHAVAREVIEKTGCRDVGLIFGEDTWEYPLWALTRKESAPSFHHITDGHSPEVCMVLTDDMKRPDPLSVGPQSFRRVWFDQNLSIYVRMQ